MRPSSEDEIFFLDKRRKKEPARSSRGPMYNELFQDVVIEMWESPSQTVTIIFEGEASIQEAYLFQQFLRNRMRKHGLRINTALGTDNEPGQAKLVVGPYAPKK